MTEARGLVPYIRHELLERKSRSLMIFVPRLEHAKMLCSYINRLLSENAGDGWEIEVIR